MSKMILEIDTAEYQQRLSDRLSQELGLSDEKSDPHLRQLFEETMQEQPDKFANAKASEFCESLLSSSIDGIISSLEKSGELDRVRLMVFLGSMGGRSHG
jgi:hypothetical protein